ncbi:MAG TPA: SpoIIE family protein phosphatase [bacterium]
MGPDIRPRAAPGGPGAASIPFDQLLADLPLGVLLVDRHGIIRACNDRARDILRLTGDPHGTALNTIIAPETARELSTVADRYREASVRVERRDAEGRRQWINFTAAPASSGETLAIVVQDITLPVVAEDVVDRSLRETELLNAIAAAASGETSLDRILSVTLHHLGGFLAFTGGSIALIEGNELVIRAASGPFAGEATGQRLRRGSGRAWQIIEAQEPFLSDDVLAHGMRPTTDLRSYLGVPLIWAGRAFGILEIDSTEPAAFRPSDVGLLRRVAAILGGLIQVALRLDVEVRAVTAADQARRGLALVAEASRLLASSLDYETTLTSVAGLLVPEAADWVLVDVIGDDGAIHSIAMVHADPKREEMARELRRRYPPDPARHHPIFSVVDSATSIVENDLRPDTLLARAADEAHFALLQAIGIRAHMVVPIVMRGRVLGALSLVSSTPGRGFKQEELELAEEIARRAARAIDTAHLYAAEQRARAEAEEAVRRVNALNALIALAASAMDPGAIFDEFGEILRTLVPFVRLSLSLYAPETGSLTVPYFKGPALDAPREILDSPKGGSVRGWVLDHDRPYLRSDTETTQDFSEDRLLAASGIRSYLIVPMRVGSTIIGTLNFEFDQPGAYTESHTRTAQPIADQLALSLSRHQLFEQAQRRAEELSETLQRALLPSGLPEPPFMSIGVLYLPADQQAGIGGDWYDALHLPDDTVLLSMGDVAGHGVAAAAAMGQVRHIVRAYALEGRGPEEILATINHYLCRLPEGPRLSLWLGILDPYSGELVYSGAGHPPILFVRPDGAVDPLPCTGPPVGLILTSTHPQQQLTLLPGARLIACTDGLIEAGRTIVANELRLHQAAAAGRRLAAGPAAEMIAREVLGGHAHEDDIAVLILDLLPHDAPLSFSFPATPELLHRVRRAIRTYALRVGIQPERVEELVFAVGEASLNTVEHAYRGVAGRLRVRAARDGDRLVVTVQDEGEWREPVESGRGRGMRLMRQFADDMRLETGPDGTVVTLSWAIASPADVPPAAT